MVTGWAELYAGCFYNSGSWAITSPPTHGTISFAVFYGGADACGNPIPYNELYYTWTDATTQATTDTFSATWTSDDGMFVQPGSWTAGRASPFKQVCDCSCPCRGEPVTLATGEMRETVTDYQTAGPNKLSFERYYRLAPFSVSVPSTLPTTLGPNWRMNFDRYLVTSYANSQLVAIVAERSNGQLISFGWDGSQWVGDSDVDVSLTQSGATFILIDADDTVETYQAISPTEAVLTQIQARNGYTQTLQYNSSQQLASVTDSYGRSLTFTYGSPGLLNTVTTPDGLVLTFGYNPSGVDPGSPLRLTSLTYSTNPAAAVSYLYTNSTFPFALTGIVDENGNPYASWAYDSLGRVTSSQHAGGADLTTFVYNGDGSTMVTNTLGQQVVYKFTNLQGAPKLTEADRLATLTTAAATRFTTYDPNGYIASRTDWNGNLTTYGNDNHGQPTVTTAAAGTPQERVTTITYYATLHLPLQIVAPGLTTTFTYDAAGNLLSRTETDTTTNAWPYSTNGQTRIWSYAWANSLPISATDPNGNTTQYGWDAGGALVAVTNALGQVTQITEHLPGGLPQTIVDPNGVTTTLAYDARNRLISSTVTTASGPLTTNYTYDAAGNLTQIMLPDGSTLTNTYDQAHRLIGVADLLNDQIAYTLDGLGNRTQTTLSAGSTVTRTHSAAFDALGRLLRDIGGVGQTTTYAYDSNGNRTGITDPLGNPTARLFDALNRLVQVTDPAGITATAYDPQDHPVQVTDANSNPTLYVYDGFGDVIGQRSPDSGDTVFYYDAAGNLVQRVDAAGAVTNYAYDALNRVTARTYPGDAAENVAYVHDEAAGGFGIGRLTSLSDSGGTLARTYDERGNVLSETRTLGPAMLVTAYAYDAASRLVAITYPSGAVVNYSRNAMGRIVTVLVTPAGGGALPVLSGIAYAPFGPATGLSYGNGIAENRSLDLDYRLTGLSDTGQSGARNLSYTYDSDDNVTMLGDNVGGAQSFGYDALNRLISANGFYGVLGGTYDPVGNRLTGFGGPSFTWSYAANTNRLAMVTDGATVVRQLAYTPTGNIASDQQSDKLLTLGYNQDNRLAAVAVQPSGGQLVNYSYVYDAFGQRLEKLLLGTPGALTVYQYDGDGHLIEEVDLSSGTPQPQVDYVYLGDRPVAMLTPGGLYFMQTDHLDTPQDVTDGAQAAAWSAAYEPFGQPHLFANTIAQNLRFPGQYADTETGYHHNGFRDYDPTLGRYVQSDPIGLRGGINTFAYARSNPTNVADPTGLGSGISVGPVTIGPDGAKFDWVKYANELGEIALGNQYIFDRAKAQWSADRALADQLGEQIKQRLKELRRCHKDPNKDPLYQKALSQYINLANQILNEQKLLFDLQSRPGWDVTPAQRIDNPWLPAPGILPHT